MDEMMRLLLGEHDTALFLRAGCTAHPASAVELVIVNHHLIIIIRKDWAKCCCLLAWPVCCRTARHKQPRHDTAAMHHKRGTETVCGEPRDHRNLDVALPLPRPRAACLASSCQG